MNAVHRRTEVPPLVGPLDPTILVIVRCGDTVPNISARRGEFASWIAAPLASLWEGTIVEVDARRGDLPRDLERAAGVILTGSSSSVTERADWMLKTEEALVGLVEADRPVLGICFGHQLLAQALGGEVQKNSRGREIGTVAVRAFVEDPIFAGLGETFPVNATHVDTVAIRPPGAQVLACSDLEPTAAFAVRRARAVQFHPEIDGDVMRGYLDARRPILESEGFHVDGMIANAGDTPSGATILRNFVTHFVKTT